jgi:hypothetical protein
LSGPRVGVEGDPLAIVQGTILRDPFDLGVIERLVVVPGQHGIAGEGLLIFAQRGLPSLHHGSCHHLMSSFVHPVVLACFQSTGWVRSAE